MDRDKVDLASSPFVQKVAREGRIMNPRRDLKGSLRPLELRAVFLFVPFNGDGEAGEVGEACGLGQSLFCQNPSHPPIPILERMDRLEVEMRTADRQRNSTQTP